MDLEKLKIIDVVNMPMFMEQLSLCIRDLQKTRFDLRIRYGKLKRGPMDRLEEKHVFEPAKLKELYIKVIDREIDKEEYPSALRLFIKGIGDAAFYKTMQNLVKENFDKKQEQHENNK